MWQHLLRIDPAPQHETCKDGKELSNCGKVPAPRHFPRMGAQRDDGESSDTNKDCGYQRHNKVAVARSEVLDLVL